MKSLPRLFSSVLQRLAVVAAVLLPAAAPLAARAETKPVAVLSLAGYDALMSDLNFLGELSGTPQLAQSVEGILALVTRAQGLVGLDKTKPIGAAVSLNEGGGPTPLVFVPVTDADKLLDALQGLVPTVEDLGDGYSRLKPANGPAIVMKEADGWAFLSTTQENLEDLPSDPAKLLGDLAEKYDVALRLNVQNVPEPFVQMAVQQMQAGAQAGLRRLPDEDDDTYRLRKEFAETYLNQMTQVVEEVDQITFGFAIDSQSRSSYLDVSLTVKEDGKLAEQIAAAAKGGQGTKFAGFADESAVANLHFAAPIMKEDEAVLLDAVEAARKEATKKIDDSDDLDDAAVKQAVQEMVGQVFDVAEATIRSGRINGGALLVGDGPFEFVVGGMVVDAKKLEGVVKRAVDMFGQAPEFPAVKLNAAEHDGVTFHTVKLPDLDDDARKILGDDVVVALGFGKDRVILAIGEDPVETAADVLDESRQSKKLPPMQLQVKLGPLVKIGAESDDDNRELADMLVRLLEESEQDHVNVTSDFIPRGSRMRIEIEEGVLEAFGKAAVLGMQRGR